MNALITDLSALSRRRKASHPTNSNMGAKKVCRMPVRSRSKHGAS